MICLVFALYFSGVQWLLAKGMRQMATPDRAMFSRNFLPLNFSWVTFHIITDSFTAFSDLWEKMSVMTLLMTICEMNKYRCQIKGIDLPFFVNLWKKFIPFSKLFKCRIGSFQTLKLDFNFLM